MKYIFFAFFLAFSVRAAAQAAANAVLNRSLVETGDTFTLRIVVNGAISAPQKVDFTSWRPFIPVENVLYESEWARAGTRWQRMYTLISFDSATLNLPPLAVLLKARDTVRTNSLQLRVSPTPSGAEVSQADGIRDIQREPTRWTDYWPLAVAVLLAIIGGAWYLRRKKPLPVQAVAPPPAVLVPAHQITLEQLAALEQQKPWKHGKTEQFYADLSLILRQYLERRFQVPALESTTREILPMLKKTDFPATQSDTLRALLQQSDLSKYAQKPPAEQAHEKNLQAARQVVLASSNSVDSHKPYSSL